MLLALSIWAARQEGAQGDRPAAGAPGLRHLVGTCVPGSAALGTQSCAYQQVPIPQGCPNPCFLCPFLQDPRIPPGSLVDPDPLCPTPQMDSSQATSQDVLS